MATLIPIPALLYLESKINVDRIVSHTARYWTIAIYASAAYLLLVFSGRRWMEGRKPYQLRRPLVVWNVALAVFSVFGTASVLPNLISALYNFGTDYVVCFSDALAIPRIALWCYLFGLSKLLELGDTAFIVLRKGQLTFLHWYHHITVLLYTLYGIGDPNAVGHVFSAMNFTVHSFMYTYFACRALGVKIPQWIAKSITLMQLSQMFVGVYVTVLGYYNMKSGRIPGCILRDDIFYLAVIMYLSYALLFLHFFYRRYCSSSKKKKE